MFLLTLTDPSAVLGIVWNISKCNNKLFVSLIRLVLAVSYSINKNILTFLLRLIKDAASERFLCLKDY